MSAGPIGWPRPPRVRRTPRRDRGRATTARRGRSLPPCPTPAGWRAAHGELVDAGDLRAWRRFGTRRLTVGVTWTPAGEGTFRAVVVPAEARTVPTFMVVVRRDATAAVVHCLERLRASTGVVWSRRRHGRVARHRRRGGGAGAAPPRRGRQPHARDPAIAGGPARDRLHAAAVRAGSVVGASLGRHALVACTAAAEDDALLAMIDEIRAILADHDLSTVPTQVDRAAGRARGRRRAADEAAWSRRRPRRPGGCALPRCGRAGAAQRAPRDGSGGVTLSPSPAGRPRTSPRG